MPIYSKTPLDALVDLINTANPNLPFKLNTADYFFGTPQALTTPDAQGRNTRVRITPRRSSKYVGSVDVDYRRLDLGLLFRGQAISITRFMPNNAWFGNEVMLPLINEKFGINLTSNDIVLAAQLWMPGSANAGTGVSRDFVASASSYFYTGKVPVIWNQGLQELGVDVMTVTDLPGRLWPDGNDFSVDRTLQAEFLLWDKDFTENVDANIETITTAATGNMLGAGYAFAISIVNAINAGSNLNVDLVNGSARSLVNAKARRVILPSTAADDQFLKSGFNRALVITNISWTTGRLVMYYNV